MKNTTAITINIKNSVLKKFDKRLEELEGGLFKEWLEEEFNKNGEALFEMLLGDC